MERTLPERAYHRGWLAHLFVLAGGFALAFVISLPFDAREARLRTIGGVLEVLGIIGVAVGIAQVRREFGLPSILTEIRAELSAMARDLRASIERRFRRKTHELSGSATASASVSGVLARGRHRPGPNASIEERVALLERVAEQVQDLLDRLETQLTEEAADRRRAIAVEARRRETSMREIEKRIRTMAVGGLRLEAVGLAWISLGLILANWSQELADVRW